MRVAIVLLIILIIGVALLILMMPESEDVDMVWIKRADDGWIEVFRNGEMLSDWGPEDGKTFEILDQVLKNELPLIESSETVEATSS